MCARKNGAYDYLENGGYNQAKFARQHLSFRGLMEFPALAFK
jgi:hypothetical protein